MKNLPMELLRTFVTIAELGGFTQAGDVLGRTQPAISLQVKRLEELVGVALFNRAGGLQLTEEGQILLATARRILELNDTVLSRLTKPKVSGAVRLGIPNDFEVSFLPKTLGQFSKAYPSVALDVSCDLSVNLLAGFRKGEYDLVMAVEDAQSSVPMDLNHILDPIMWVTSPSYTLPPDEPVPLITYPKGCLYRQHMIQTLNEANIPWRIVYSSSSLLGIRAAIKAGLGISALAKSTVLEGLEAHNSFERCPPLGCVTIGFSYDRNEASPATNLLLEYLRKGLKSSQHNGNGQNAVFA